MSERPSGLNPEELFEGIEPNVSGAKPLQESDLSRTPEEETKYNSPAMKKRRERETAAAAEQAEGVDIDLSELEDEPVSDSDEAVEIVTDDQDKDVEIEKSGLIGPKEADAARAKLGNRLEQLQAGQELSQADVQSLMYDLAEQVALEKFGSAAPLDNIKDSQGNAVDFWNARPDAYQIFERQVKDGNPESAFRIMETNLEKWVPEFQGLAKQAERQPSAEALALEKARQDLVTEGLNKEKETLGKLSEQLKSNPDGMPDQVLHRRLAETMKTLVNSNAHIPGMNELIPRLAPHVPDIKGTNVIEKTKEYIIQQALTTSKGDIKRRLLHENPESVLAAMVGAIEGVKPGFERRIKQEQERQKRQRDAKKAAETKKIGAKPEKKRSWLDRLLGRKAA